MLFWVGVVIMLTPLVVMVIILVTIKDRTTQGTKRDLGLFIALFAIIMMGGALSSYGSLLSQDQDEQLLLENDDIKEYCRYLGVTDDDFIDDCKHLTNIIPNGSSYASTWSWLIDPKSTEICREIINDDKDLFEQCISELQSKGIFTSHLTQDG